MHLYLDFSASVKLYINEHGRATVRNATGAPTITVTSRVAYAEVRSALARVRREWNLGDDPYSAAVTELNTDWKLLNRIDVSGPPAIHAGALAETHALRGFDAVHLASALRAREVVGDVRFLAFDVRLIEAAEREGLTLYRESVES